jgi:NitT/TauT family transport system permease protein
MMYSQPGRTIEDQGPHSRLIDIMVMAGGLALFYGILAIGRTWFNPLMPEGELSLRPWSLPVYAAYSLLRLGIAYILSLCFAVAYGYAAAYSEKAERILVPALDILQSIPVLSFLPGVMLAMAALFPHSQAGLELGSIILIFTGMTWNMAFSFYSSVKSIPADLKEAARINRFSFWQRFVQLELPYSAIGLVWNSMMSVAGGWFFLMVCEMFPLGDRQVRLPGLGSYLQTAANDRNGNVIAICYGLAVLVGVIVLLDALVWRPVIAWANKFKFEEVEGASVPYSAVLSVLRRSSIIGYVGKAAMAPLAERMVQFFADPATKPPETVRSEKTARWVERIITTLLIAVIAYGVFKAATLVMTVNKADLNEIERGTVATFLRVMAALIIGAAWTIPAGVSIGLSPKLAKIAQPIAQVAASVPATGLFPVVLVLLLEARIVQPGGGLGVASLLLMLLGTQWYILFNVIAGAMAIPTDLKEAARVFKFGRWARWRFLIIPAIFPYLITGMVTAAGGAWNASIVAEYMPFQGQILRTTGLGATIADAASSNNFSLLLASTIVMAALVVTINRTIWRRLYRLAQTRFKLET